jgi:hypothetical protein
LATDPTTSDCNGEKLPSVKYGTHAMCCSAVAASPLLAAADAAPVSVADWGPSNGRQTDK